MKEWQIYRRLLNNIKECRQDRVAKFGTGLELTPRVIKQLTKRGHTVFQLTNSWVISGYMPEEVLLIDTSPTMEEFEAYRASLAVDAAREVQEAPQSTDALDAQDVFSGEKSDGNE